MKETRYVILEKIEAETLMSKIDNLEKLIKELQAPHTMDKLMSRTKSTELFRRSFGKNS